MRILSKSYPLKDPLNTKSIKLNKSVNTIPIFFLCQRSRKAILQLISLQYPVATNKE